MRHQLYSIINVRSYLYHTLSFSATVFFYSGAKKSYFLQTSPKCVFKDFYFVFVKTFEWIMYRIIIVKIISESFRTLRSYQIIHRIIRVFWKNVMFNLLKAVLKRDFPLSHRLKNVWVFYGVIFWRKCLKSSGITIQNMGNQMLFFIVL